jgi:hypothetical protein
MWVTASSGSVTIANLADAPLGAMSGRCAGWRGDTASIAAGLSWPRTSTGSGARPIATVVHAAAA